MESLSFLKPIFSKPILFKNQRKTTKFRQIRNQKSMDEYGHNWDEIDDTGWDADDELEYDEEIDRFIFDDSLERKQKADELHQQFLNKKSLLERKDQQIRDENLSEDLIKTILQHDLSLLYIDSLEDEKNIPEPFEGKTDNRPLTYYSKNNVLHIRIVNPKQTATLAWIDGRHIQINITSKCLTVHGGGIYEDFVPHFDSQREKVDLVCDQDINIFTIHQKYVFKVKFIYEY